jgi:hypothetical protein
MSLFCGPLGAKERDLSWTGISLRYENVEEIRSCMAGVASCRKWLERGCVCWG